MEVRGIYDTNRNSIINSNPLASVAPHLPIFDESKLFWLEMLGEGGSASVHKAYDKHEAQFIAIKKFTDKNKPIEEKWAEIMVEDNMLQAIENIRSNRKDNEQYFLKYSGVFRNIQDPDSFILQMENGRVSLDDILRAGKKYTCAELIYVHRKLSEGFAILQENGIANRDVKPGNIILAENPMMEGSFCHKISDFGISCKMEAGICTAPVKEISGLTREYAAPEILLFYEKKITEISDNDVYNPFLADVFSFGVLTIKMIDRHWSRKDINFNNLKPQNFPGYEQIIDLLVGMLAEDPNNRWDFKKILKYHKQRENDFNFSSNIPTDEGEYIHKYFIEYKERKMEKTFENLEKLFQEHQNMFIAYTGNVPRPKEAKFHIDRAWDALQKMKAKEPEKKLMLNLYKIRCLIFFGDWNMMVKKLKTAEDFFKHALRKNEKLRLEDEKFQIKFQPWESYINDFEANILEKLGVLYEEMGDILKAEEVDFQSLKIYQNLYGENHFIIGGCLHKLGFLNKNLGRLTKSKNSYLKALNVLMNVPGDKNNGHISATLNDLGLYYYTSGKLSKAKEYYLKALEIGQNLFGENHSNVASTLNNLGALSSDLGDYFEAEEFYLRSLKIRQSIFGENHSSVATSIHNLGSVYQKMGKLAQAEDFYLKSLKIERKLFGENHKDVATTMNDLGTLYLQIKNFPKSTEFLITSLKINLNLFGESHPDVLVALFNIGLLFKDMGNIQKAEKFYMKAWNIGQNLSNENNFFFRRIIADLAELYHHKGNFLKAEKFYLRIIKIFENTYGKIHSELGTLYGNLGALYYTYKNFNKMEEFDFKAVKTYQTLGLENKSIVMDLMNNLGMCYKKKKKYALSAKFYLKALNIGKNLLGEKNFDMAVTFNNLSQLYQLYESRNKKRMALNYSEKAFFIFNIVLGSKHPLTIHTFQHYQQLLNLITAMDFGN